MNAQISLRILALMQTGMTISQAIDEVLGAGTYKQIASDVYDALNA